MSQLEITHKINYSDLASLLCSGMEGGIGYWAAIYDYIEPEESIDLKKYFDNYWSVALTPHIHYPLIGGEVILQEIETDKKYTLNFEAIKKGLNVMYDKFPNHYADFISGNFDAITGDVFIQCCVFNDIIYG